MKHRVLVVEDEYVVSLTGCAPDQLPVEFGNAPVLLKPVCPADLIAALGKNQTDPRLV